MKPAVKRYLEKIYYDPEHPGSFSGVDRLYRAIKSEGRHKISRKKLEEFLRSQETYGVHRKSIGKFHRPKVVVSGVGIQADADLADLSSLAKFNDGYKFVLIHVDVFSKYARTIPLRSKTAREVTQAFGKIFESGGKTYKVRTDKGSEFRNRTLRELFEKEGGEHFVTQNVPKASVAERLIKTLKSKYFKYMTQFQTFRYIDIVDDTTQAYNSSYHRSIKTRPADVTKSNEAEIFAALYRTAPAGRTASAASKPFKYNRGDHIRASVNKKPFDREYQEKWTYEIYKVKERDRIQSIPVYTLEDYNGETLAGRFYSDQLQPTTVSDQDVYKIEKVIKSRKRKGHPKEVFVKWYGWDSSHNSWLPEKQVEDIRKSLEQRRKGKA